MAERGMQVEVEMERKRMRMRMRKGKMEEVMVKLMVR